MFCKEVQWFWLFDSDCLILIDWHWSGCWCLQVDHQIVGRPCGCSGRTFLFRGFLSLPGMGISKSSKTTPLNSWSMELPSCYWRIWSMRRPVFYCPLTLRWIKVGLAFSSKFQLAMSSPQKNHKPKQDHLLFISLSLVPWLCPSFWCYWFLTTSAVT